MKGSEPETQPVSTPSAQKAPNFAAEAKYAALGRQIEELKLRNLPAPTVKKMILQNLLLVDPAIEQAGMKERADEISEALIIYEDSEIPAAKILAAIEKIIKDAGSSDYFASEDKILSQAWIEFATGIDSLGANINFYNFIDLVTR